MRWRFTMGCFEALSLLTFATTDADVPTSATGVGATSDQHDV